MSNLKDSVDSIRYRFTNHSHQTDSFTWDYLNATDDEVFNSTPVMQETLDGLAWIVINILSHRQRPELKKQILYLSGLREKQSEVWERKVKDFETRTNNTKKWVLENKR